MRRILPVTIVLLILLAAISAPASADYSVRPSIDVADFIMYSAKQGNVTVRQVVPTSFRIQWYGEYDKVVNGWWNPFEDPANYRYEVSSKAYTFRVEPPQIVEYGDARILLNYFTSLSVVPYATKTWYGYFEEHVKVIISVYAYGTIDKPPSQPTSLDLSSLMSMSSILVDFSVTVVRTSPSSATYTVSDTFNLILEGVVLKFYELYARQIRIDVNSAEPIGGFSSDGYIGIAPKGSIYVELCLKGPEGYKLSGEVSYVTNYGTYESKIDLSSSPWDGCSSTTIQNAVVVPGDYRGSNKFALTFRSGAIMTTIVSDAEVRGALGRASIPFIALLPFNNTWNATVYTGIDYVAYQDSTPFYVEINGTVYVETRDGTKLGFPFACNSTPITEPTTYICNASLGRIGVNPFEVTNAYADVTVSVSMYGVTHSDTVTVTCALISPSSVHGLVAIMYRVLINGAFIVLLLLIILYTLNYLASAFGRHILDPYYILQAIMAAAVLVAMIFVIPYFHSYLLSIVYSLPEFSDTLRATPLSDPGQLLGMPPDQAIAMLMGFYDMTLNRLKLDYKTIGARAGTVIR